eukprot:4992030-Amphidinium_carterae.1
MKLYLGKSAFPQLPVPFNQWSTRQLTTSQILLAQDRQPHKRQNMQNPQRSEKIERHYGRHYYSSLYKNNFYKGDDAEVDSLGRVDEPLDQQQIITKHVYIPLEGPVMWG